MVSRKMVEQFKEKCSDMGGEFEENDEIASCSFPNTKLRLDEYFGTLTVRKDNLYAKINPKVIFTKEELSFVTDDLEEISIEE